MGRVRVRCRVCRKRSWLSKFYKDADGRFYHPDCAGTTQQVYISALSLARAKFYDEHVNPYIGYAIAQLLAAQGWLGLCLSHDQQTEDKVVADVVAHVLKNLINVQLPTQSQAGQTTGQWMPELPAV